ncbi:MAG TPA: sn-glycerol-3-phosphate ABC transporter ATP-binding protein UgpC [Thermoanaerobaculia bacterium]|nr:sn-glycerol-3-phosphate ABC transporter ATP-binding protein UgpC [Thermoanaerobaculia bacterium]
MARVALEGVRKIYDNGHVAVHDATFEAKDGELLVFVGPSGCGKSTLLRMIAGLETISGGTISIGDRVVNEIAPKSRDIAMVFQSYALYPHMTVYENMAFGLELRRLPRESVDKRVREAAGMLGLETILERKPKELSGGQRQRVALGRALVREPAVFLLDEPLSNLDAKLRLQTRTEIARLHRQLKATMIYVTHDQTEAMTLGDRIVVLDAGRVQQIDTPMALYREPVNRFVAGFIGSPAMNFVEGRVIADGSRFASTDGALEISLSRDMSVGAGSVDAEMVLGVRPEDIAVSSSDGEAGIEMALELLEPVGNEIFIYARAGANQVVARVPPQQLPLPGETIRLAFQSDRLHLFDRESGQRIERNHS